MTVDNIKESYQGLNFSRAWAEHAAREFQAEGRQKKVEESKLHPGQWIVYSERLPGE